IKNPKVSLMEKIICSRTLALLTLRSEELSRLKLVFYLMRTKIIIKGVRNSTVSPLLIVLKIVISYIREGLLYYC
ncbi:hypothetical protein L9F63_018655, partial [Diploptera punctata]